MHPPQRIPGWDLLRGVCAIAVAGYHLLMWLEVAQLHTFGTYGVYLFFVLSGASLAYTYAGRYAAGSFSFADFLRTRYLRLAPPYLALMAVVLPWKLAKEGAGTGLLFKYVANGLFFFGLCDPAAHAVLVGGWSLGIEALFYVLFPLVLWCIRFRRTAWALLAATLALQAVWIYATVGRPPAAPDWVAYHQLPAFAGYFVGGCMIGAAQRHRPVRSAVANAFGPLFILAAFALMLAVNPTAAGQELVGWRGILLCGLCFFLVHVAADLRFEGAVAHAAQHLGDATYGLYLLHPVVFFGLVFAVLPRLDIGNPTAWPLQQRWMLASAVGTVAFALAWLEERYLERPLRRWGRRRMHRSAAG
jgi:peptidoglycan/LPS O-acetylase OafA/YrhL